MGNKLAAGFEGGGHGKVGGLSSSRGLQICLPAFLPAPYQALCGCLAWDTRMFNSK